VLGFIQKQNETKHKFLCQRVSRASFTSLLPVVREMNTLTTIVAGVSSADCSLLRKKLTKLWNRYAHDSRGYSTIDIPVLTGSIFAQLVHTLAERDFSSTSFDYTQLYRPTQLVAEAEASISCCAGCSRLPICSPHPAENSLSLQSQV